MSGEGRRGPQRGGDEDLQALLLEAALAVARGVGVDVAISSPGVVDAEAGGGAFVTLRRAGVLAGCIGYVTAPPPLVETVRRAAQAAAFEDPRFPPVTRADLEDLEVEVSILSVPRTARPEEVEVGRHGLILEHPRGTGLLLPQVALEHHLDREAVLDAVAEKAGLPRSAWRDASARLRVFTVRHRAAALRDLLGEGLATAGEEPS